jgi:uncharacterized glyoxalase superfamily protein PhnB
MSKNRSVPTETVLPHIAYQNVADAIVWQMYLGDIYIMLKSAPPGQASPAQLGYGTQSLTVFVDDVDAHFRRAQSEGAKIVEDLNETCYGERQYGVEDLEGHHWLFSRHAKDLSPDEWGAKIAGH